MFHYSGTDECRPIYSGASHNFYLVQKMNYLHVLMMAYFLVSVGSV